MEPEQILSQDKNVRLCGGEVVRPLSPWSPYVHHLLRHLRAQGIPVPRPISCADGEERLEFLEGEQVHPYRWSDEGLAAVAQLVRKLHTACQSFKPDGDACWQPWYLRELGTPSLCSHGDIAPWNVITRAGMPIGLIDWEFSGPIDPMVELARVCWLFPQLVDDDLGTLYGLPQPDLRAAQVRLIADAYGLTPAQRGDLVEHILQAIICETAHEAIDPGITAQSVGSLWGFAWRSRSLYWVWRHRDNLAQALR